ncbi:adenylate/guanylate cyclase domain-containing protein [Bradyrhizobium erythrophlei]|uniref:adenylate/guanylate cyclase domain-containing protein n=1 Tax=Bradyrhizobium erythrophlei TaxID=1437360 RepID=UPI0035E7CE35
MRWIALAVIAVMLPITNPRFEVVYLELSLLLFAVIGWGQLRVGTTGRSIPELILLFCDLALLTAIAVVPNPLSSVRWPLAMQYHFPSFIYFFVLFGGAALSYSWRTMIAMGLWSAALWIVGIAYVIWWTPVTGPLSQRIRAAVGNDERLFQLLDPNHVDFGTQLQIVVVFVIVAATLAVAVRRSHALVLAQAAAERSRANLSRYFSATVVEELARNDEPFRDVRTQSVGVLFVDIVEFTRLADSLSPTEVIETLRVFHARMEQAVFEHGGTLDKFLGDGLMATFGTPLPTDRDAGNALRCAQAMIRALDEINDARRAASQAPIEAGIGLHYGPVVLGDIGMNRLEFAVIGGTVNLASRLEALTRQLGCQLVASDAIVRQASAEAGNAANLKVSFEFIEAQAIRGIDRPMSVWIQRGGRHGSFEFARERDGQTL